MYNNKNNNSPFAASSHWFSSLRSAFSWLYTLASASRSPLKVQISDHVVTFWFSIRVSSSLVVLSFWQRDSNSALALEAWLFLIFCNPIEVGTEKFHLIKGFGFQF